MKVTFLGTGGAFTDFRVNYHNNLLVDCGLLNADERYILIDCGATAVQSLKELGIQPWQVEGVIVTHLHGDHIAGIEQLLWERYYTGPQGPGFRKTCIYATRDVLDGLWAGLNACVDEYTDCHGVSRPGGYEALVEECVAFPYEELEFHWVIGELAFRWHETPHVQSHLVNKSAYGIEILDREKGHSIYYTSDTMFRKNIGDLFPEAQVIFHDCTFYPKYPGTVHTHYEELCGLPASVKARTVLMHYTQVPEGIDIRSDGFLDAALRHQTFDLREII